MIGENKTFLGGEAYLKERGVEVVVLESQECMELMRRFIEEKPGIWYAPFYFLYSWSVYDFEVTDSVFRNEDIGEQ